MTYDLGITTYDPEGNIKQVTYAAKAVEKGDSAVGIVFDKGALLTTIFSSESKLLVPEFSEKIFKIEDNLYIAASGISSDIQVLVRKARVFVQNDQLLYKQPTQPHILAEFLANEMHNCTQQAPTRPYGVSLLLIGFDDNTSRLFEINPAGVMRAFYGRAIGNKSSELNAELEKKYNPNLDEKSANSLVKSLFKKVNGDNFNEKQLSIISIKK